MVEFDPELRAYDETELFVSQAGALAKLAANGERQAARQGCEELATAFALLQNLARMLLHTRLHLERLIGKEK